MSEICKQTLLLRDWSAYESVTNLIRYECSAACFLFLYRSRSVVEVVVHYMSFQSIAVLLCNQSFAMPGGGNLRDPPFR